MTVESPSASTTGASASTISDALACSRCDGPVNPDDLVEGLAVRIDGLTVCALCIETLSPALRIQINRVRALKGLAVVTYRVTRHTHPTLNFYSFTNAGMLLLHRRALVHGTEFSTPDLPASIPPADATGQAAVHLHSPPNRSKLPLYFGLGAAVIVVMAGILAVTLSSHTPSNAVEQLSGPNVGVPVVAEPTPIVVPLLPVVDSVKKRELKDYRSEFADENAALEAGLSDNAPPELINELERDVLARGRTHVERLTRMLQQTTLGQRELDDINTALTKAQPPARPAFVELQKNLDDLAEIAANKQRMLVATAAAAALTVQTAPASEPVVGPGKGGNLPSPLAHVVTPVVSPVVTPPTVVSVVPPVVNTPATVAAKPPPSVHPVLSWWSGDIGPKSAVFTEPVDPSARIPSPWPFFISSTPPRFAAAVKSHSAERKDGFILQLSFPPEQVQNGGVYLTLYPKRKELLLTRLDVANTPAQVLSFTDREQWQGFSYRIETTSNELVTLQISEANETNSDPFWIGATAAISNGDPTTLADELSASPLLSANPLLEWTQLVASLKSAARGRKQEQRWNDPKFLATSAIKILGPKNISAEKLNAALRLRRPMPDVENQIEVANLRDLNEVRKLFANKANPGLFSQKVTPTTIFLITDGMEATTAPADWAKHVRQVNELLRNGEPKLPATGFVPVWVIGSLSRAQPPTTAWSLLRTDRSVLLLDLTMASADAVDSAKKIRSDTYQYLAEGITTLMYQLRLVQITQRLR